MRSGPTRKTFPRWSALLVAALIPAGCDDTLTEPGFDEGPGTDMALLSVYLTDAPGDVVEAWVDVVDVVLVGGEGGPVSLLDEPTGLIDVLELRDDAQILVADKEVEPGSFSQIRFILGGAVLKASSGDQEGVYSFGGAEHPNGDPITGILQCPSCAQTGIKVLFPGALDLEAGSNGLLLDFDVAQSFGRQAGQSGRWVMRPVVKGVLASPAEIEGGELGAAIQGTVTLAENGDPVEIPECGGAERTLADFLPAATSVNLTDTDDQPFRFVGETDEGGAFEIRVWEDDAYDLGYVEEVVLDGATLHWTAEVEPASVIVEDGEDVVGVIYTITGASCQVEDDS
jgi:hypothetical protein